MKNSEKPEDGERIISIENAVKPSKGPGPQSTEEHSPPEGTSEAGELSREELTRIAEALLFAADSPLSASVINNMVGAGGPKKAAALVDRLGEIYDEENKPYFVQKLAGGYQLRTRPEFHPWVGKLHRKQQQDTLSQAALETLSIIAYRQPMARADIEDIRGVQSGYILRSLIEKSLVKVTGRSEKLGRPLLYGTTKKFLETFGLASLSELPPLEEPGKDK